MKESDFVFQLHNNTSKDVFCAYNFLAWLSGSNSPMFRFYKHKAARDGLLLKEFFSLPSSEADRQKFFVSFSLDILKLTSIKLDINLVTNLIGELHFGGK